MAPQSIPPGELPSKSSFLRTARLSSLCLSTLLWPFLHKRAQNLLHCFAICLHTPRVILILHAHTRNSRASFDPPCFIPDWTHPEPHNYALAPWANRSQLSPSSRPQAHPCALPRQLAQAVGNRETSPKEQPAWEEIQYEKGEWDINDAADDEPDGECETAKAKHDARPLLSPSPFALAVMAEGCADSDQPRGVLSFERDSKCASSPTPGQRTPISRAGLYRFARANQNGRRLSLQPPQARPSPC